MSISSNTLQKSDKLYSKEKLEHNYPHCWRCGYAAGLLREAVLVYRNVQAQGSAGCKQQYRKLVSGFRRRKAFRQLACRSKGLGNFQIQILGNPDSYLEMRMRTSALRRLTQGAGGTRLNEKIDESIELHRPYVDDVTLDLPGMRQGV